MYNLEHSTLYFSKMVAAINPLHVPMIWYSDVDIPLLKHEGSFSSSLAMNHISNLFQFSRIK